MSDPQLPQEEAEVTVVYKSKRSGNNVTRTGTVDRVEREPEDEEVQWTYSVLLEREGMAGGLYLVVQATEESTEVFSLKLETSGMSREATAEGSTYTFSSEVARTTHLGEYVGYEVEEPAPRPIDPDTPIWGCQLTSAGYVYVQAEDAETARRAAIEGATKDDVGEPEADAAGVSQEPRDNAHRLLDAEGEELRGRWE